MFQLNKRSFRLLWVNPILLTLLNISIALGQVDSIAYHIGVMGSTATQQYLPHWITANRFGILDDNEYAVSVLRGGLQANYKFFKTLKLEGKIDAVAKQSFRASQNSDFFLQQAYLQATYSIFELTGGRIERTLGTHAEGLSSGSLALSGNTRPIPMIFISVPEFESVPFTKGFIKFKGTYGHGWLEKERYVKSPYLHEKSFYLNFGGDFKINFSAGIVHFVIWGGEDASIGKLPSDFKDYLRVIMGKSGEGLDTTKNVLLGETANALGDNLGIYDFGLQAHLKNFDLSLYHQTPFEDWTGTRLFRNRDRLLGLHLKNKKTNHIVSGFVYEFLYTKYQSGPGLPGGVHDAPGDSGYGYDFGGRDNYYNNYLYKTGWVYQDRILGTPLFFTLSRARLYFPGFVEPDRRRFNFNVVNNRVTAHHVGFMGKIKKVGYKFLSTLTKNYGTYGGINGGITEWGSIENPDLEYAFKPARNQYYFLLELESHPFSSNWSLLTTLAWDTGDLTRNVGILVGLKRQGLIKTKK